MYRLLAKQYLRTENLQVADFTEVAVESVAYRLLVALSLPALIVLRVLLASCNKSNRPLD